MRIDCTNIHLNISIWKPMYGVGQVSRTLTEHRMYLTKVRRQTGHNNEAKKYTPNFFHMAMSRFLPKNPTISKIFLLKPTPLPNEHNECV